MPARATPAAAPAGDSAIGVSRFLGLPAAVALGLPVSLGVALFVLGIEILRLSGGEAPLAFALAAVLYLPLVLCYGERAGGIPGVGGSYHLARAGGSPRRTFAAGWLMLGGYLPLAALLVQGLARRLGVGVERLFGVELGTAELVTVVIVLAAANELFGSQEGWRLRSVLVWGAVLVFAALVAWAFFRQPTGRGGLPEVESLGHWLTAVALLAAGLWSLEHVLDHRGKLRRPRRVLLPALAAVWIAAAVVAAAATLLALRHPDLMMANWLERLSWAENRLELAHLAIGVTLLAVALSHTLSSGLRLVLEMARDGLLPPWLAAVRAEQGVPLRPLVLVAVAAGISAARLPVLTLAGLAAVAFLWNAIVALVPRLRPRSTVRSALPLHPLFPALAVGSAAFLSLVLPSPTLEVAAVWTLLGALYFLLYARHRSRATIQRELQVDGAEVPAAESEPRPPGGRGGEVQPYRVLVAAGGGASTAGLLRAGAALARRRQGELLALRTVPLVEQVPVEELREHAAEAWRQLDAAVREVAGEDLSARALVRIAPTPATGILDTAAEQRADFLVLGAPRRGVGGDFDDGTVVEEVFAATSRPVAVVHGTLPDEIDGVTVATAGGPHAPVALEVGAALAGGGRIDLVTTGRTDSEGEAALRETRQKAEIDTETEGRTVRASDPAAGIARAVGEGALLLLGASVDRVLGRTVSHGLAAEVAAAREGPTIIVKRAERASRFWRRRLWEVLSRPLPAPSVRERAEVYADLARSAHASVDFYVLIFLAAAIATLGLILDSGAVIIGAMLVAPLMSPILGMAQGIVQGNLRLIRRAGASTAKGTAAAIGVGAAAALLLARRLPTAEMLARSEPNLLDLLVALAAGAAAAYAVSRKSVAAALPGVAISVALVPPLCVVGWGLGASDFALAGGALLLYVTNLAGIVLVGATVFLLLGFRPTRAERGQWVGRGILLAIVAILLLAIPLGLKTRSSVRTHRLENRIAERLRQAGSDRFLVRDVAIERQEGGFLVSATVYAYRELDPAGVDQLRRELESAVAAPVEVRLTLVEAEVIESGGPGAAER